MSNEYRFYSPACLLYRIPFDYNYTPESNSMDIYYTQCTLLLLLSILFTPFCVDGHKYSHQLSLAVVFFFLHHTIETNSICLKIECFTMLHKYQCSEWSQSFDPDVDWYWPSLGSLWCTKRTAEFSGASKNDLAKNYCLRAYRLFSFTLRWAKKKNEKLEVLKAQNSIFGFWGRRFISRDRILTKIFEHSYVHSIHGHI